MVGCRLAQTLPKLHQRHPLPCLGQCGIQQDQAAQLVCSTTRPFSPQIAPSPKRNVMPSLTHCMTRLPYHRTPAWQHSNSHLGQAMAAAQFLFREGVRAAEESQLTGGAERHACHLGAKRELLGRSAPLRGWSHDHARSSVGVPHQPQVPLDHASLVCQSFEHPCRGGKLRDDQCLHQAPSRHLVSSREAYPMPSSSALLSLMSCGTQHPAIQCKYPFRCV